LTDILNYLGRANSKLIEQDFTLEQMRDFSVRKEVIRQSDTVTDADVSNEEARLIIQYESNNPEIGYNRWSKFKANL